VAEKGDEVDWDGLRFRVVELAGQRIERLEVEFFEHEEPEEETEPAPDRAE
jgi:CBS domain containing-hemolysin-like protein